MRAAALVITALVLVGGCTPSSLPTRVSETVTNPERLRPGTAGTVSILDNALLAGCQWLRADPGRAPELVHQFTVPCADMELHWSADGERALLLLYQKPGGATAWEADLATGALRQILFASAERNGAGGYVSPSGAITLKTIIPSKASTLHRAMNAAGFGEACTKGVFRGYRSDRNAAWVHVDDVELDCGGAVIGDLELGDDYTWSRPGVQESPDPGRPGWVAHSRGRGDYLLVPGAWHPFRVGPDGIPEPSFGNGRVEFWPAPVLSEWPVPAANDASGEW